jgi:two-component system LytT family response regulator
MKPLNAVVVDDEKEARELLSNIINDHIPQVNVIAQAASANEAIGLILERKPEIVFLDIDMPVKNGFDVARSISQHNIQTSIVFVTAFNQFAIEAIKHSAFDYLLKPVTIADLKTCVDRLITSGKSIDMQLSVIQFLQNLKHEKISFRTRIGNIYIDPQDITHAEADGNYTDLHLQDGSRKTISLNLGHIETILANYDFSRISRSMIINRHYLHLVNRKEKLCILLVNGHEIPLKIKSSYLKDIL